MSEESSVTGARLRLTLMRHAKSDWGDPDENDHDRPLSPRGQRAAAAMAVHLAQLGVAPDHILCSSARRTRETLAFLCERLEEPTEIAVEEELYLAPRAIWSQRIEAIPDDAREVLIVGHNPGMEELAAWLDPESSRGAPMPTAAVARFELMVDRFADLGRGCGSLLGMEIPKSLL